MDMRNIEIDMNEPSHIHVPRPSRLASDVAPPLVDALDFTDLCGEFLRLPEIDDTTAA